MIPILINKVKAIQVLDCFKDRISEQQNEALIKLQNIRPSIAANYPQELNYLDNVINLFSTNDFLIKTPSEIDIIVNKMPALPQERLDINNKIEKVQLTHVIQKQLGYTKLRDDFYPAYFKEFGIKACVYCNSQLTIIYKQTNGDYDARLEIDHHYPKSIYPYLSISLFNLYPCCSSCNRRKSKIPVNFKLYTDDITRLTKSEYQFQISPSSKCDYLLSKDPEKIEISFVDNSTVPIGFKSTQDVFGVKEIHETQKDLIAELIIKDQIYNDSFKKLLQNNFSKLALSQKDFQRVIVGNYTDDRDIHKRPFSKMMMDVAKQLDLIKKE